MEKKIEAENWDGTIILVKIKDLPHWSKWDIYNKIKGIHPTQDEFTEAEFLPKSLHPRDLLQNKHS